MKIITGFITIFLMILFIVFPTVQIKGAINGLLVCSEVIIPSLFPFTVLALFLFNSGFTSFLEKGLNKPAKLFFRMSGKNLIIFLVSFIGGFPVGARLIEEEYKSGFIDKKQGENMLAFCVNSGPAFIIIGVGSSILNCKELGVMLFISNFLASCIIAFVLRFQNEKCFTVETKKSKEQPISDVFVESTAKASSSIIGICGFVILFSTLIEVLKTLPILNSIKNVLCSLLEITNGTIICDKNIYLIAFLLGFGGICVHFQILSVTKNLKPNYLKFLIFRCIHGVLTAIILFISLKINPVVLPTISGNVNFSGSVSSISLPFAASLVLLCTVFLQSLRKN